MLVGQEARYVWFVISLLGLCTFKGCAHTEFSSCLTLLSSLPKIPESSQEMVCCLKQ